LRRLSLVCERLGRHRKEHVVGERGEDVGDVAGLERGDEAGEKLALLS
jgi:hypothetical protein